MENSTDNQASKLIDIMNIGAIFGASLIVLDIIFYLIGQPFSPMINILRPVLLIVGLVLSTRHIRNKNFTTISYSKIFWVSVKITFFAAILFIFYKFIFMKYIYTSYIDDFFTINMERIEQLQLSDEFKNDFLDKLVITHDESTPLTMAMNEMVNIVVWGIFISLISSIWLRKQPKDSFSGAMSEIEDKNDNS